MAKPIRLRLSRAKGFDLQAHSRAINGLPAVNVARPSKWGNPFVIGEMKSFINDAPPHNVVIFQPASIEECVTAFEGLVSQPKHAAEIAKLRGHNLACWCDPNSATPCHADVLLRLANEEGR